jgi:subtilase family serine protease
MNFSAYRAAVAATAFGITGATAAFAEVPYPTADTPKAADRGLLSQIAGGQTISVTIPLKLRDPEGAESLLRRLNTPGDAQFHQFLTPEQFQAQFGPANADVAKVSASLARYGLTVERASSTTLRVSGTPVNLERAFGVTLHQYEVPATDRTPSYVFRAPLGKPSAPSEITPLVHNVLGLDTVPSFRPQSRQAFPTAFGAELNAPHTGTAPPDAPGQWTVTDFAEYYDVQPLYTLGLNGSGRTIGIVTLASFTPSDAFAYWNALRLTVDPKRLTVVNVDGGPGAPSDDSGSLETTVDVEQSGGIAPAAKIIVYQAPRTNQGFFDAFAAAIDANLADSISVSWGDWEWFYNLANSPVTDPFSGKTVSFLQATHELFVKAAIQGQSLFAAAGDFGAYDANDNTPPFLPPDFSLVLSVDYPGSDPAVTSAGGTTLGATLRFSTLSGVFPITIPAERVWGWDYIEPVCTALGNSGPYAYENCGIFSVGGGGGVSVFFPVPIYQLFPQGVQRSQPNQTAIEYLPPPVHTIYALPANYPGRNVPDVSLNADPNTGYLVYYTSSKSGFGIESYWGGTSFVGPQLNGVTALLSQYAGHRLGLLNYPLYALALSGGYQGSNAPLRYIAEGDN